MVIEQKHNCVNPVGIIEKQIQTYKIREYKNLRQKNNITPPEGSSQHTLTPSLDPSRDIGLCMVVSHTVIFGGSSIALGLHLRQSLLWLRNQPINEYTVYANLKMRLNFVLVDDTLSFELLILENWAGEEEQWGGAASLVKLSVAQERKDGTRRPQRDEYFFCCCVLPRAERHRRLELFYKKYLVILVLQIFSLNFLIFCNCRY